MVVESRHFFQPPLKGEVARAAWRRSFCGTQNSYPESLGRIRITPKRGHCEFALDSIEQWVLTANPSVRPFGLPAPLSGEPGETSPERGGGPRVAWRWGFAVRRIPFGKPEANSHNPKRTCYVFARNFIKPRVPAAKPLSQAYGLPAQLCIKQLYAALRSATPAKPCRGARDAPYLALAIDGRMGYN